ncbi:MAG TPA: hypothetical protein VHP33_16180 [Polyangiaceae bacterium]|nr:hypothetical protein [Polyangiaceae bacterium]
MAASRNWALLVGAAVAGAAGCLVVTPLDDLPAEKATNSRGGAGNASSGHAGTPAGGEGGEGAQPNGGSGGLSGTGGVAPGSCQTNAECVEANADEPYRCRPSDHTCVALRTDDCPIVTGAVSNPNAIYFGAFATLDGATPEDNPVLWAHQLALGELGGDNNNGGLPDGLEGKRRPLVMIACENRDGYVGPAMKHLAEEVQVPAVIGTLKPGDLLRAYEDHAKRDIFYLSPVSITRPLIDEDDDGRIWNLLGQPSDFAPTYAALLKRSEAWLRKDRKLSDTAHLKVALVTTGDAFDSELRDSLLPALRFNDLSLTDNGDDFLGVELDGSAEDLAAKAVEIATFAPDIVISAASELFVMDGGIQQLVEDEWGVKAGGHPRPFYILSPYNAGDVNGLLKRISGRLEGDINAGQDQQRYVGVSIAPAADISLQNAYGIRLRSKFKDAIVDTANYYDAIYYLAYAMYGAREPEGITGSGIARGMQRLFSGDGYKVGPTTISATFKALSVEDATIHLDSTLGPPEFDPKTGVRPVDGGVFCFKSISTTAKLVPDVLRYNPETKMFTGDFSPCNAGF